MGSFGWEGHPCCVQYHNGRPLSVALIEPADDSELSPFVRSDFTSQCRSRSRSSGRRVHRESYRIYHPNVQYAAFHYSPPFQHRAFDYGASREGFVEKFETITIEDQQCQPKHHCVAYTPVRQVKIRSRPSSCVDLHRKEAADQNQWTQIVDERTEEHHDWHYNFTIPIRQESSAAIATQREDIRVPVTSTLVRPLKKDTWTSTDDLPRKARRPLSISETQVLERYEKNEKIRRDSVAEKSDTGTFSQILYNRPIHRSFDDDDSDDKQPNRASKKLHRKDFIQRVHAKNGTRPLTSLNIYPERNRNQMIVRPTVKPREALVDAPAIVAPPGDSEPSTPSHYDIPSRSRDFLQ